MKQELTPELLATIMAFAAGKKVQSRVRMVDKSLMKTLTNGFTWEDDSNPPFEDPRFEFRIKPVVRSLWIVESKEGEIVHASFDQTKAFDFSSRYGYIRESKWIEAPH